MQVDGDGRWRRPTGDEMQVTQHTVVIVSNKRLGRDGAEGQTGSE